MFPPLQHPSYTAGRLCKAGPWLCFVTRCSAPTGSIFPCSISHSATTNKAELSAEHGGGGGCQMAPWSPSSYFATRLLFLSLVFCACCHYSAHSLLNPSSHPSSSQSVATLLVIWEAWQGRCVWHLLQHMVPLLLRGALSASASPSSMSACVHACVGCQLFSCPLKQGPCLLHPALTNTVKRGFWIADNLLSEQMVPCR